MSTSNKPVLTSTIDFAGNRMQHRHYSEEDAINFFNLDWPEIKKQIVFAANSDIYGLHVDERVINISLEWVTEPSKKSPPSKIPVAAA